MKIFEHFYHLVSEFIQTYVPFQFSQLQIGRMTMEGISKTLNSSNL
uniref:Uncharacterized protein n=1 Tax=Rhizophora mucronata TaxID=61149 RepID=A0A2P2NM35_RHIMU